MVMFFSSVVIKLSGVAVLLAFETISSCWTWYVTDISFPFLSLIFGNVFSFPFLSPHYQSHRVIGF